MARTIERTRELLIDNLEALIDALNDGQASEEWIGDFEDICGQVATIQDLESPTE